MSQPTFASYYMVRRPRSAGQALSATRGAMDACTDPEAPSPFDGRVGPQARASSSTRPNVRSAAAARRAG